MSRFTLTPGLLALLLIATILPIQAVAVSTNDATQLTSHPGQTEMLQLERNNSSVHHENPEDVRSEDDLSRLEGWLAGQLSSRLQGSSVQIEQGQYQKARSVLGDDYNDLLGKYVEVSGQTKGTQDDKTAKTFKNTQESQQKYVSKVQRYRKLHDRYQRAKQNGNDEKARRLARTLNGLAKNINQSSGNLTSNYGHLSNNTNISTKKEIQRVQNVTQNISTQQAAVRETEFVQTDLSVSLESDSVSFLEPITITGELTDENGTAIENQSIRLLMGGNRTKITEYRTDEDGEFTLTGRPAVVALGEQSFRVEYIPQNDSVYLGSNETVEADVSQVESNISITSHTERVRYNKSVAISGTVKAEGIVASDVPVDIFVGNRRFGTTRTAENGSFSFKKSMPANFSAGKRTVRVSFPFRDRALIAENATAPITIEPSATTLTLSGTVGKPRNVEFSGKLQTKAGTPIMGQQVAIFANGTKVTSTKTNENGTYKVSTVLPAAILSAEGNTTFVARFDGSKKNVESARDSASLAVIPDDEDSLPEMKQIWLIGFGVAALVVLGGFFLWQSTADNGDSPDDTAEIATDTVESTETPETTDKPSSGSAVAFLDRARSAYENEEFETAVKMGYAAIRIHFDEVVPATTTTHWEFYTSCQESNLSNETVSSIGDITERYEEVAFAEHAINHETALAVIDAVSSLLRDEQTVE